MNGYGENDNQYSENTINNSESFKMPCVNMELYSSAYAGSTGQKHTAKGQKKIKKNSFFKVIICFYLKFKKNMPFLLF